MTLLTNTSILLRIEAAVAFIAALVAYWSLGQSWWIFALLFFVPDLGMLGYLHSPPLGARIYNTVHSYAAPALVALLGLLLSDAFLYSIAAIWIAHIGFDRILGYGLKLETGFEHTHLGPIGKARRA